MRDTLGDRNVSNLMKLQVGKMACYVQAAWSIFRALFHKNITTRIHNRESFNIYSKTLYPQSRRARLTEFLQISHYHVDLHTPSLWYKHFNLYWRPDSAPSKKIETTLQTQIQWQRNAAPWKNTEHRGLKTIRCDFKLYWKYELRWAQIMAPFKTKGMLRKWNGCGT